MLQHLSPRRRSRWSAASFSSPSYYNYYGKGRPPGARSGNPRRGIESREWELRPHTQGHASSSLSARYGLHSLSALGEDEMEDDEEEEGEGEDPDAQWNSSAYESQRTGVSSRERSSSASKPSRRKSQSTKHVQQQTSTVRPSPSRRSSVYDEQQQAFYNPYEHDRSNDNFATSAASPFGAKPVRDDHDHLVKSALARIARARSKQQTNINLTQDEMEALLVHRLDMHTQAAAAQFEATPTATSAARPPASPPRTPTPTRSSSTSNRNRSSSTNSPNQKSKLRSRKSSLSNQTRPSSPQSVPVEPVIASPLAPAYAQPYYAAPASRRGSISAASAAAAGYSPQQYLAQQQHYQYLHQQQQQQQQQPPMYHIPPPSGQYSARASPRSKSRLGANPQVSQYLVSPLPSPPLSDASSSGSEDDDDDDGRDQRQQYAEEEEDNSNDDDDDANLAYAYDRIPPHLHHPHLAPPKHHRSPATIPTASPSKPSTPSKKKDVPKPSSPPKPSSKKDKRPTTRSSGHGRSSESSLFASLFPHSSSSSPERRNSSPASPFFGNATPSPAKNKKERSGSAGGRSPAAVAAGKKAPAGGGGGGKDGAKEKDREKERSRPRRRW
ncbi:uncharacterized protein K489DRAFT_408735 [Dissoconium aciculare CBS 342.82]|uniref:Uncharacterized protein n=1 Tax=Dissoconium aciculare CBS 342.82 TaxID=1314786 RepID=A0A6J3MBY5_9PEZI|nr:uncharacterized protein K489DRAFT_408735 [Dissoconium aciculare CBS 342.82]KAF1824352.1 hypothetical protein K489DRAFT_408735 [Dissoconium aciculare CBS 342.82]